MTNNLSSAITNAHDCGAMISVLLDMSGVFVWASYTRLLPVFKLYCNAHPFHSWLGFYLTSSSQIAKVINSYSAPQAITSVMIQDSILSPLWFLIYKHASELSSRMFGRKSSKRIFLLYFSTFTQVLFGQMPEILSSGMNYFAL